jgi:hydroxyacylglutathione hydrolase
MNQPNVTIIECLKDNYAYLLVCPMTGTAAVVDPSEEGPVVAAVERVGVNLTTILNTHHHWDHTGGNTALLKRWPGLTVAGHESDKGRIPGQTLFLADGDSVTVGQCRAVVYHIPGHTTGAVAYAFDGMVFTGDTLFYAGCGRLFEGTPAMMYGSLVGTLLERLNPDTQVYFGHEYTVNNLLFAQHVEPDNPDIAERLVWAREKRAEGLPTVPSTMGIEAQVNPFVRASSAEELGRRRAQKDVF